MVGYLQTKTTSELRDLLEDLEGFPEGIVILTAKQDILSELHERIHNR